MKTELKIILDEKTGITKNHYQQLKAAKKLYLENKSLETVKKYYRLAVDYPDLVYDCYVAAWDYLNECERRDSEQDIYSTETMNAEKTVDAWRKCGILAASELTDAKQHNNCENTFFHEKRKISADSNYKSKFILNGELNRDLILHHVELRKPHA